MKVTKEMVVVAAKAMERQYHKGMGMPCDPRDDGPDGCWKTMIEFARVGLKAALKKQSEGK